MMCVCRAPIVHTQVEGVYDQPDVRRENLIRLVICEKDMSTFEIY